MLNAYIYSAREYGDMVMCLGQPEGNALRALRIYTEKFPNRRHPSNSGMITAAFQRVLENRPIAPVAAGGGRETEVQTEVNILDVVRRNPRLVTRSIAKLLRRRGGSMPSHNFVLKCSDGTECARTKSTECKHLYLVI
ncbi:unnamed protein product [Euphydryas editha]|uniref:DUF4817 domain-containing protein n=1 Tax=Euphydryas editha TaxID=104508 RepID=A0AAU9UAI1_EUPED|nr:unnamed protein product [Euphydryas editha]